LKIFVVCLLIYFPFFGGLITAQSDFNLTDDSVCIDVPFTPINQSRNSINYLWHFNTANLANKSMGPTGANLGNTGFLSRPAFIALAEDKGNYYTFTTNYLTRNIIRNSFFNSLSNNSPPSNNIPINALSNNYILQGIQIVKDANNWYGFTVGGRGPANARLTCLFFGTSLTNAPTLIYNNTFSMNFPMDLTILNDNGHWIGFTVNQNSNSITRFDFNNGLNYAPVGTNFSYGGNLLFPSALSKPVKDNYGNWHMFVICRTNDTLKRVEFGNSLLNPNPKLSNMNYSSSLSYPTVVRIIHDCTKTYGLIANSLPSTNSGFITQLDFVNGIENEPVYTNLGNIGSLNTPLGMTEITRSENDIFAFIVNEDRTLSRIQYQPRPAPPTSANVNSTTAYSDSGVYYINLVAWQDSVTKSCSCKPITVMEKPHLFLGNDTTVCPYDMLRIDPKTNYQSYLWNTSSTDKTIKADTAGLYWLKVTNTKGCADTDSIVIDHYNDDLFLGNDTTFTLGESITLNVSEKYAHTYWSTGQTDRPLTVIKPGIYTVMVQESVTGLSDKFCTYTDTIVINLNIDVPNFFTPNSDGVNDTWSPHLLYHYPEAEIYIYDRFGKQLTQFKGNSSGWDGTYNNHTVDTDTYWYVIDLQDGSRPIRGPLTVKTK
jgi:gliding motility-associated-like protein